jgi:hypothetical protein
VHRSGRGRAPSRRPARAVAPLPSIRGCRRIISIGFRTNRLWLCQGPKPCRAGVSGSIGRSESSRHRSGGDDRDIDVSKEDISDLPEAAIANDSPTDSNGLMFSLKLPLRWRLVQCPERVGFERPRRAVVARMGVCESRR